MSDPPRCSFCLKLPVAAGPGAGRPGKCPLCKGDLLVAARSGVTYRLAAPGEVPTAGHTAGRRLAVVGAAAAVLVGAGLLTLGRSGSARPGVPAQPPQVAAVVPPVTAAVESPR